MPDVALNYAPPTRRRRYRAVVALILAAMATGIVGKLCWDKFSIPVRKHLSLLDSQRELAKKPGQSLLIADPSKPITDSDRQFGLHALRAHWALGDVPQLTDCYHGPIRAGEVNRILCVEVNSTALLPDSAITLVARVYSTASLFAAGHRFTAPQYLILGTFRSKMAFDTPQVSATDPSILVITGTRDDVPFRYELSLDSHDTVRIVEDSSVASRPRAK